jgi:uncharacterized protein (TIGR02600 family)
MELSKHTNVGGRLPKPNDGRIRGAALIIVLSFLIIITGLVVSFLSTVTDNATETSSAAAAITTRSLADTAVQLTIAQIRDATAGFKIADDGSYNTTVLMGWSSQPGAIRTFDTNRSNGVIYRLYSAPVLRTNTPCSNDLPSSGWWKQKAIYTDLNAPVVATKVDGSGTNTNYPILDPSLTNTPKNATTYNGPTVDGFTIASTSPVLAGYTSNTAAMPVLWLYMLKDGSLIPPDTAGDTTATFNNSSKKPTSNNPIVGRIAFWTDDETCKLNINTASEGVPWDVPQFTALEDTAFVSYTPVGNEYHRFKGHPFSVSLSPVLWSFFGFPHPASLIWANPQNLMDTIQSSKTNGVYGDPKPVLPSFISGGSNDDTNYLNALFGLSNVINGMHPRSAVSTNGSIFGSYQTASTNNRASYTNSDFRSDRLYSSVDELAFSVNKSEAAISRAYNSDALSPDVIAKLRFFLTASSRSPEVNIFNLPRICLWPLPDPAKQNTNNPNSPTSPNTNTSWSLLDQQIARCETIGKNAYYFTRFDAASQTNDFQGRNVALYGYLANLLKIPIPGYQNSFQSRFGTNGPNVVYQTATMLLDYIRSSVNLVDSYGSSSSATGGDALITNSRYAYSYTVPPSNNVVSTASTDVEAPGTGQVLPLIITTNGVTTRGMGRFPIIKSATLAFVAIAADQPPLMITNQIITNQNIITTYNTNYFVTNTNSDTHSSITNPYTNTLPGVITNSSNFITLNTNNFKVTYTRSLTNTNLASNNVNPLYPFPVLITNVAVNTNFWEIPVSATLTPGAATYNGFVVQVTNTNTVFPFQPVTNQYPSWYPTNGNLLGFTNKNYNNQSTNPGNTSSYLMGTIYGMPNAQGVTITHPGLVYGGDYNTNPYNPYNSNSSNGLYSASTGNPTTGTNYLISNTPGFNNYNAYFSQTASNLGISVNPNQIIYQTNIVTNIVTIINAKSSYSTNVTNYTTNFSTNTLPLNTTNFVSVPNTSDPLFPSIYQTVMQPVLILDYGIVNPGHAPYNPNFKVRVKGLGNLTAEGKALFGTGIYGQKIQGYYHAGAGCGFGPDFGISTSFYTNNMTNNYTNGSAAACYPFLGNFIKTTNTIANTNYGRTFAFSSSGTPAGMGTITIDLLKPTAAYDTSNTNDIIQSVTMSFPPANFPTPKLPVFNGVYLGSSYNSKGGLPYPYVFGTNDLTASPTGTWPSNTPITFILPKYLFPSNSIQTKNYFTDVSGLGPYNMGWLFMPEYAPNSNTVSSNYYGYGQWSTATTLRSVEVAYGDWRIPAMMQTIRGPSNVVTSNGVSSVSVPGFKINDLGALYAPHRLYWGINSWNSNASGAGFGSNFFWRSAHTLRGQRESYASGNNGECFNSPTMFLNGLNDGYYKGSNNANYPGMIYSPVRTSSDNPERLLGYRLSHGSSTDNWACWGNYPESLSTVDFKGEITNSFGASAMFTNIWQKGGDFDNGPGGLTPDGPYINKADEGSTGYTTGSSFGVYTAYTSFQPTYGSVGRSRFSPNRQIPSSGIFGSLPVGFDPKNPSITNAWQTLLFCPNPNSTNHVSLNKMPPDYMIMDLFEMPVVQPYPISAPLSTAGRVNLNYQIAPFNYIKRDSALRGVLKSVQMTAVRDDDGPAYKYSQSDRSIKASVDFNPATNNYSYRFPIHLDNTLKQFDEKFSTNGFFCSGAEICSIWLYPAVAPSKDSPLNPSIALTNYASNVSSISNWWYASPGISRKGMTGDNSREAPYAAIYPNITTKSNTYEIHYRVQTLKQTPFAHTSDWSKWVDPSDTSGSTTDKITGDLRGSAIIERYIDASNEKIPDFAGNIAAPGGTNALQSLTNSLDPYYRYRVLNSRIFTP